MSARVSPEPTLCSHEDPINRVTKVVRKGAYAWAQECGLSLTKAVLSTSTIRGRDGYQFLNMMSFFSETSQPLYVTIVILVPFTWACSNSFLLELILTLHMGLFSLPKVPSPAQPSEAFQNA